MKDKFQFIYSMVTESMKKLDERNITVDEAKAMSALAKQANNVLTSQLDAAKFINTCNDSEKILNDVGL